MQATGLDQALRRAICRLGDLEDYYSGKVTVGRYTKVSERAGRLAKLNAR
jgi:hypothetical protein